jgi:hypothetical protein
MLNAAQENSPLSVVQALDRVMVRLFWYFNDNKSYGDNFENNNIRDTDDDNDEQNDANVEFY